jgi:hypothetical protein
MNMDLASPNFHDKNPESVGNCDALVSTVEIP